jgi:DNA helicase HerA-like ATPase
MIDKNEHYAVFGQTRSGKTTSTYTMLARQKKAVIFFNTQQIIMPGYVTIEKKISTKMLYKLIQAGKKCNYVPDRETRQEELTTIIKLLYNFAGVAKIDLYLVIDEIHLFEKRALKSAEEVATTGIRWGIHLIAISQRPAKVSNTILTQATSFLFFKLSIMERQYLESYRIPFDEVYNKIKKPYEFVIFDSYTVSDAKKINI